MEINIINREKNELFNREELVVKIDHKNEATPKRDDIKSKVAAMVGKDDKLVVVRKIITEYGKQSSKAYINVYDDQNLLLKLEPKHILKRNKIIQ
ncbi:30S ribosomal protein S24e [Nanobdella aerobiophila]|uniref:Small ribosomal subunit protein eS24 n=1 Tax=Nanobdella aerobiophila TaxID=2586965 RepID=A0A915SHW7_9ARCH|nr:30S ribosomal protein S24e [Nanobdella aerobiophila]BBL45272.1 30S ribosomal protein S24e [Nanobdella aerobiophila]